MVRSRFRSALPLLLVLLLGAALRLYHIGDLPPGLYRDEAFYGLDAVGILNGTVAVWYPANNGREGLYMLPLSLAIAFFGQTVFALRITSALIGIATLVAVYAAGQQMFSQRIGVLSAAVMAVTFWHVALSRVAYRAITLPLLLCITMALLFAALRAVDARKSVALAACCGLAFGITFYTYTSAQMLAPLLAVYGVSLILGLRREFFRKHDAHANRRRWLSLGAFCIGAAVALAPLAVFITGNSEVYFARAGQVSILNPAISNGDPLGTLVKNLMKAAGMFVVQGDRIWRHNLPQRPVFDGFLGFGFLLGSLVCLWRWWRSFMSRFGSEVLGIERNVAPQFVVLWLIVFLVPTVLAEDTPHFLRAIGALPAACVIVAVGLEAALGWASRRGILTGLTFALLRRFISPPAFVASLIIALSAINTVSSYFNDYARREMTGYWLEAQHRALSDAVNAADNRSVWIDPRLTNDNAALRFLSGGRYTEGIPVGAPLPLRVLLDPKHDWSHFRDAIQANRPVRIAVETGPLAQGDRDPQALIAFIQLDIDPASSAASQAALQRFDNGFELREASSMPGPAPNDRLIRLVWHAGLDIQEDHAIFIHWLRNGQLVAQHDGDPGAGYWPTRFWRAGDEVVDMQLISAPGGFQTGDQIIAGLYRRSDNRRVNTRNAAGELSGDYAIIAR
jgi:4-amino-4-deoxy-L-arabinose transferase-like glycosyltransferase